MSSAPVLISAWMKGPALIDHLKTGDLIEIKRTTSSSTLLYYHWVVYTGNETGTPMVIHYSTDKGDFTNVTKADLINAFGGDSNKDVMMMNECDATVRYANLLDVVQGDDCRKNNYGDKEKKALGPDQIVRNAESELGKGGYHILTNNCEIFSVRCRYGAKVGITQVEIASSLRKAMDGYLKNGLNGAVKSTGDIGIKNIRDYYQKEQYRDNINKKNA
uniref:LRAT domain-containing protein n=1 Tax=Rhabditophanes sp. KR3021 TaxID=114890 RepID=A0AC35UEH2_9BILA